VLQYACNSEIRYRLRGVSVRQTAEWRQREPEGAGDLHRLTIRGSRCHVLLRQDEETGYKAMLHLVPAAGVALESRLPPVLAQWQEHFPGLAGEPSSLGVCLRLPPALERGHESQFALVLNAFLDHLDRGTWPKALPARIRMRYTLLAQAQDLGRGNA
jgi:hypothetical protein